MSEIGYFRIHCDGDGRSHFDAGSAELASTDYAPPAAPLNVSPGETAQSFQFLELPAGWIGEWHPTPVRQWLVMMSGECEFEVEDGGRFSCRAGDVVLLEDMTGKGHRTCVTGAEPVRIAATHLA